MAASQVDLIMPYGQTQWEEVLLPEPSWGKSLPLFSGQLVPFCWELEGFGDGELQQSLQGAGRLQLFKTSLLLSRKDAQELRCVCMKIFGLAIPALQCLLEGSPKSAALPHLSDFASHGDSEDAQDHTEREDGPGGRLGWREDTTDGMGSAWLLLISCFPALEHRHGTQCTEVALSQP